jgi:molecular chaperone DnaJ
MMLAMEIDFAEAVNGCQKTFQFNKAVKCNTCQGTKVRPGSQPQTCPTCQGKKTTQLKQGTYAFNMACNTCQGQGTVIKDSCTACRGQGIVNQIVTESVSIPRGVDSGTTIKIPEKGNASDIPGGRSGDLLLKVNVKKHP